jgi:cyanophycin synthetase
MKILSIKVMKGPNYWSNYRKNIVVMKLDLEELESFPTNKIKGFPERIEKILPSLFSHRCSENAEGGFFLRVREGTWMGHVIEHIALEIQTLAGMNCGYGRTRSDKQLGVYNVIFSYTIERAGVYAANAAVRIAEAIIENKKYDIQNDIENLKKIAARDGFGPSTQSIINEAVKRGIPYRRINAGSGIIFGQGVFQKQIRATMTSSTSCMGVEAACDKNETKEILTRAYIPTPQCRLLRSEKDLKRAVEEIGFPLVIKPVNGNHGRGITTNILTHEQATEAYEHAVNISKDVLIEKFLLGCDYRFLVINYKMVAVAHRTPAMITGDGFRSIQELIDATNCDTNRGDGHEKIMTKIKIDKITLDILAEHNFTLSTILARGEILYLKDTANISTGGTATDVTDEVHPANIFMAERIARIMNLDICGIDVIAKSIDSPITNDNGGVLEVNACPGFRMHLAPSNGKPRNVAEEVIDMLYPSGAQTRIPLVAVTGTNGKTTTTRLIAHMAKRAGLKVGYTTTDGTYIQDHLINKGDCTGPASAQTVLTDPTVNFAVLECARGGILRAGLGFDHCDVSIITNISEDHLGLEGIDDLYDLTRVKSVVARSTFSHGYAILNADDKNVYKLKHELDCNIALFSTSAENTLVQKHCETGGLAVVIENNIVTLYCGANKLQVEHINNIPLSFNGKAGCMVKNILPAVLAAYIRNITVEDIRSSLQTFIPSPEFTPGRMNVFNFKNFKVMVDYAHNSGGFSELKDFLEKTDCSWKVGIVAAIGDRRDEDIQNVGYYAARIFDEVILRHDSDLRGRTRDEITMLVLEGARKYNPEIQIKIISNEYEAVDHAILHAKPGTFITVCTDNVVNSIHHVTSAKMKEDILQTELGKQVLLNAS